MTTLDDLPAELLTHIFQHLSLIDVTNLSVVNKRLKGICDDPFVSKDTIKRTASFSNEAKELDSSAAPRDALLRIRNRRRAMARGEPCLTFSLGAASSFIFSQGVVFWNATGSRWIRVLETQSHGRRPDILISKCLPCGMLDHDDNFFTLLHFSDGILSILYEEDADGQQWLIIASVLMADEDNIRPLRSISLNNSSKIFVRNTSQYLYYGTYSFLGSHGNQEWLIKGVSLKNDTPFAVTSRTSRVVSNQAQYESNNIFLTDFVGDNVGTTADFLIHDGYFYAVTNVDDFDAVEIDWTSFYHCYRFPVDDPQRSKLQIHHGIFRRQHLEGPMHDGWLKLSLQIDERTNEILIVETRKEWLGNSDAHRSVYITKVQFSDPDLIGEEEVSGFRGTVLADDMFARYATSSSKFRESEKREYWQVHQEKFNLVSSLSSKDMSKSPLLAHTKYQAYDVASKTFIDIVEDFSCCSTEHNRRRGHGCLRLRTCSRRYRPRHSLLGKDHMMLQTANSSTIVHPFVYDPVSSWPPHASSSSYADKAHAVLAPSKYDEDEAMSYVNTSGLLVHVASNERTVVLLVKGCATDNNGKLVILGFDSQAAIKSMDQLGAPGKRQGRRAAPISQDIEASFMDNKKQSLHVPSNKSLPETSSAPSIVTPGDSVLIDVDIASLPDLTTVHMWNADTSSYVLVSQDENGLDLENLLSRSWADIWTMNMDENGNGYLTLKQDSDMTDEEESSDNTSEPDSSKSGFEISHSDWSLSDDMMCFIDLDEISC